MTSINDLIVRDSSLFLPSSSITRNGTSSPILQDTPFTCFDSIEVSVVAPPKKISVIAIYQSPIAADTTVYPIPVGYLVSHNGKIKTKTFTLEPDTKSVWWTPVGWYYDQTVNGSWVSGIPEDVGTITYPDSVSVPEVVYFSEVTQ